MRRGLVAALAVAALAAAGPVSLARADGDPASDWLLVQSTFLSPFDGHVAQAQKTRLVQLLGEAAQKGLSLKVAVIVTAYDLGSVPVLFREPQTYAKFLGEEDYYYWKNELLVVMPNGYGLYDSNGTPAGDAAAIRALRFHDTTGGTALVVDAEKAVSALAARHGIPLSSAAAAVKKPAVSTGDRERIEILAALIAALVIGGGIRFGWRHWAP